MLVRDVMESRVEVIAPGQTLVEAAQKMRDGDIGSLPVVEDAKLIGIITDRDIVIRCVADGADPKSATVREATTEDVVHCLVDQSVEDASKIMAAAKVRRLPVIDHERRLVGIVALGDISREGSVEDAGEALHDISEPTRPHAGRHAEPSSDSAATGH